METEYDGCSEKKGLEIFERKSFRNQSHACMRFLVSATGLAFLRELEGFHVEAEEMTDGWVAVNLSSLTYKPVPDTMDLEAA